MRCFMLAIVLFCSSALLSEGQEKKQPVKAPLSYFKVEVRGTLQTTGLEDDFTLYPPELANQSVKATVVAAGLAVRLAFGENKDLAALAKKLSGKSVLVSGDLHRAYDNRASVRPTRFIEYISVTGLKAAE